MKFNKKTKYFVRKVEFKTIKRNPFIAGILSIFLGMLGIHRFYLKRKSTGFIFCVAFICSLAFNKAYIAAILMLLTIIEGIIYMVEGVVLLKEKYINRKVRKNKEKNDYMQELRSADDKKESTESDEKEENDLDIIEVSDIEASKIPDKSESDSVLEINWTEELDLPYETNIIKAEQVRREIINLYEDLCNFIDKELRSNKTSLEKEIRKMKEKNESYDDILHTIYGISEGHIAKAYRGSYDYYNLEFLYKILEKHFGKRVKDGVDARAQEAEECISPPNIETLKYFHLAQNRMPAKWWDIDGRLRSDIEFNSIESNILEATPIRSTKVWEIYKIKKHIIILYLETWKVILNELEEALEWKNKVENFLKEIAEGKCEYFEDYENGGILASLVKISENTIRETIPSMQILNIHKEKNIIEKYLPDKLVKDINDKVIEYKESITTKEVEEILRDLIESDDDDWRLKVEEILITEDNRKACILINYRKDKNFIKIAKEIIKNTKNEDLLLLCLYGIGCKEKLSSKNIKILKGILYSGNVSAYKSILESEEELSLDLLDRLLKLKNPVRKKIKLNMDKVKESEEELSKTVKIVKEYIGSKREDEEIEADNFREKNSKQKFDDKLKLEHEDFLRLILDKGPIEVEEGKKIAMNKGTLLNAFISDVNRELYEYVQDQAIVVEDDFIKIDDFYMDMVKELLANEK